MSYAKRIREWRSRLWRRGSGPAPVAAAMERIVEASEKSLSNSQGESKVVSMSTSSVEPETPYDDVAKAVQRLIKETIYDPNFPQELLIRAQGFVEELRAGGEVDAEAGQRLIDDFQTQQDLAINSSAYQEVRAVVDTTDDARLPVFTWRVFILGSVFCILGTAMLQFFSMRMPSIAISPLVVQLLAMPVGKLMARWLPSRRLAIGRVSLGRLNPGPFNYKELLLVAMMANVCFSHHTGAYIVSIVQVLKLPRFYARPDDAADSPSRVLADSVPWQVMTLLSTQLLGYGCAGLARRFLVYPPMMIWPRALASIGLSKALFGEHGGRAEPINGWTLTRHRFFVLCFGAMFVWFWVPNYLFQALALFNWPTWFAPGSVVLAIVAGSSCGLGLNPLPTLDWTVASFFDPIITPFFTIANFAAGMALAGFVVAPLLYFYNVFQSGYLPINSNKLYDNTGAFYRVHDILGPDLAINETAYRSYSIPWQSTTQVLNLYAYVGMYMAMVVHAALWFGRDIARGLKALWRRQPRAQQFNDVHNRLMQAYPECPHWWYLAILAGSFVLACLSVTLWPTGMPIWGIVMAAGFTILLQVPIGMLAAMTNIELPTSLLSMLVGGYVLEGRAIANMLFKMFSYLSTSQSLNFLADLKLAHYAKIPPRAAFTAQVYATVIGGLTALAVNHWALRNIDGVCVEGQAERLTCPGTHSFFLSSVLWGVVGPRRLFGPDSPYRSVIYIAPVGMVLPALVFFASRRWPTSWVRNINGPLIIAGTLAWAPYNWSYMQGSLTLAFVFNYYIKRRYKDWWQRYAFILSIAFTAASGLAALVLFFTLQKWGVKLAWWGNSIAAKGVDQGGWVVGGNKVQCVAKALPASGRFASGF
ncbi:hypothetical protein CDD81_237 [Ophiocordyceps australis]|uniref:OPT family small oligopeptide transporter n=1 Tax=Ophiocordyceps australis TaxID=1399860 RepID=A0A2C5YGR0_9HYPO|nr:hypothetical protein CDD81_237 [Ophiocordyceps australis]